MKQGEDLRRVLIDASLALLDEQGLEAFSMREVARRAGVSHQAPYHHFADREAILAEIVAEGFQQLRAAMQEGIARVRTPRQRLVAIGKAYVAFALAHPATFKLMFSSEHVQAEHHQSASACAESAFGLLVSVVDDVVRERRGKPNPSLALAAWGVAHGLATLLLEGKLKHQAGAGKRAQTEAAYAALESFLEFI